MTTSISSRIPKAEASITLSGGLITGADQAFTSLTGYAAEEIIKRPVMDFLRNELRATFGDSDLSNTPGSYQCFIFTRLLKPLEVRITIKKTPERGEYSAQFRKIPAGIHAKSVFAAAMLMDESAALACYTMEPSKILLSANRTYLELMNISDIGCAAGKKASDILPDWHEGIFKKLYDTILSDGKPASAAGYGADEEGGPRYLRCRLLPVFDRGRVKYLVEAITGDIPSSADQKPACVQCPDDAYRIRNEQALTEPYAILLREERAAREALARDIEAKDEFIAFITHEFKTPLAIINSAVQAIEYLCGDELTDQFRGFLKKIKQNSFRQLRLVNNLLDMSRLEAGRFRVLRRNMDIVHLAREITESVRLYAQQKKIALEFRSEMPSRMIGIDEEKFERIMLNLLSNAIKYTPENRHVRVSVTEKESGEYISVAIADEGVGIPREKQHILFERFGQVENSLTRQSDGTGIGLSLVKKMVSVLNGTISVESESGKGSTFEVILPVMPTEEDPFSRSYDKFTDSRLAQAIEIEFSDIYL